MMAAILLSQDRHHHNKAPTTTSQNQHLTMEFGKVSNQQLTTTDFVLPPDPPCNSMTWTQSQQSVTKFFIGCATWGNKDWVGSWYPAHAKSIDFLHHYARLFNAVEFNAAYYGLPTKNQVQQWKSMVPPEFRFCPKFQQSVTHHKRLRNAEAEVDAFLLTMYELGDNLGPILLLPHPQMGRQQLATILRFLEQIPQDIPLFLELRHPDWFANGLPQPMLDALYQLKKGLVITDTAGRRDCLHMHLTIPETLIRFVGNDLDKTDYLRVDLWASRLQMWMANGLQSCYLLIHQPTQQAAPALIQYFIKTINRYSGINIPELTAPVTPGTLF